MLFLSFQLILTHLHLLMYLFSPLKKRDLKIVFISLFTAALITGCHQKSKSGEADKNVNDRQFALQYLSENKLDDAVAAFQQAIKINPDDTLSYIGLSRLYLLQKNYDAAEKLCKQALKMQPGNINLKLLLAQTHAKKNERENAIKELNEIIQQDPKSVGAYYQLAELDTAVSSRKNYLLKVQDLSPANIVPRLQLAELLATEGKTDSCLFYLQSVKKMAPQFSVQGESAYESAVSFLHANKPAQAFQFIEQFVGLMKITPEYASGLDEITIPDMIAGYFNFDTNITISGTGAAQQTQANSFNSPLVFTDFGEVPGSVNNANVGNSVIAVTDYDAVGNMYLYSSYVSAGSTDSKSFLSYAQMGVFKDCKVNGGIDHKGQDLFAAFADYDNNGYQDLFVATTEGILVYKNNGDGTFSKVTENIGLNHVSDVHKILFADFDQDGDLDMYVAEKNGNQLFRNNGDGTFSENPLATGLSGGTADMDFGDWDQDGDNDIIAVTNTGKLELLNNNRHSNFTDITAAAGLQQYSGTAVSFGDYNNDGRLDILLAGGADGKCFLLKNEGNNFVPDQKASDELSNSLKGIKVHQVAFIDYDNDGQKDIVIAGDNDDPSKKGVRLFHNEGTKGFSDVTSLLPANLTQAFQVAIIDFNFDGDRDLFFAGAKGAQIARNDGGNSNNYVQVQLTGLSFGSSKNNRLGIGGQVEIKAGDLYQVKTVKGALIEFGLGQRTKIDALRIIWPNGVAQTIVDPMRKQRALEEAQLKGSCPFLFTWNGKEFVFLKDMLWRSALGMPVAIHGRDTTFAYHQPSKEYLLIPGDKLQPRNGLYTVKISEELWEAVYFDKASLTAVDHPDSVDAYVDERFVAPPYPGKKIYLAGEKYLPVSATDGEGNDVLPKLSQYDFQYVSNFSLGKFQGVAKEHDLILDLGKNAESDSLLLYMRGWIFPPDASINTELTQTNQYKLGPPSLQVINKEGKWQTVIKDIGYPMGRDKMDIVNLAHKFLTPHDRRIRIRTTMQIYWDHIFFTTRNAKAPVRSYDLKMVNANLDFRGYSASYNKGGPFGPQWFDYYKVTKGQKWRDLTGNYTRYGDVLPLLQKADDQYIICNGGDEVTIDFDAKNLPPLPKGWKRDFLIYSEGWVKDGDMNTEYGQTVAPLPFHNMPSYPYGKNVSYPNDKVHRDYLQKYNTRKISTESFTNAIRLGTYGNASK